MKNKKTIFVAVLTLSVALYISIPTTFLVFMLGLLIIPPVVALASIIKEGFFVASREFAETDKESQVVIT